MAVGHCACQNTNCQRVSRPVVRNAYLPTSKNIMSCSSKLSSAARGLRKRCHILPDGLPQAYLILPMFLGPRFRPLITDVTTDISLPLTARY